LMRIKKAKIHEGQVVAVPANDTKGYICGVIARTLTPHKLSGEILLYFFPPRYLQVPEEINLSALRPDKAIDIVRTGVLRIHERKWPIVGELANFARCEWPIPAFGRVYEFYPKEGVIIRFENDNLAGERTEEVVSADEASKHKEYSLWGVDIAAHNATIWLQKQEVR